jgi:hypothetical protein
MGNWKEGLPCGQGGLKKVHGKPMAKWPFRKWTQAARRLQKDLEIALPLQGGDLKEYLKPVQPQLKFQMPLSILVFIQPLGNAS